MTFRKQNFCDLRVVSLNVATYINYPLRAIESEHHCDWDDTVGQISNQMYKLELKTMEKTQNSSDISRHVINEE